MLTPSSNSRYQSAETLTAGGNTWYPPLFTRPILNVIGEKLHIVSKPEEGRPDLISYSSLGDSALWWVIMEYNNVVDPLALREGDNLRIPLFTLESPPRPVLLSDVVAEEIGDSSPPPPAMAVPVATKESYVTPSNVLFSYNFQVEKCLVGRVHYEIQIALDSKFTIILMGRLSALSLDRWYCLGADGYSNWPASGLLGLSSGGMSAYFLVLTSDPLVKGGTYYARVRNMVDNSGILTYGPWFGSVFTI